jgi:probable rRNA maturation factor
MNIFINNNQKILKINKIKIRNFIKKVLIKLSLSNNVEVSITFVDNQEIKNLNKQYRNIDKETDVLSFPFQNNLKLPIKILGDVVISTEKAILQAEEYGHSIDREIYFLIVHGILHLLGYDHKTKEDEKIMFSLQKEILLDLKNYIT